MVKPKVLIIRTAGTNCDFETGWAFELAGAIAERVHINLIRQNKKRLKDYQVLVIPGGFSYGDDISAGKVLANEINFNLHDEVMGFAMAGKPMIGICNGFQAMVKAGLLPSLSKQAVTLSWNDSAKFEARWVHLSVEKSASPFFNGLPTVIQLPIAHAEGKFIAESAEVLAKIEKDKLPVLRYCNREGELSGYPSNPNGSANNIAGICDITGMILGMMPHPERCLFEYFYPERTGRENGRSPGFGLKIFQNIVSVAGGL